MSVYARVTSKGYSYKGHPLRPGTIVKLTADQMKAAGYLNPPHLEKADKPEDGAHVVDLTPKSKMKHATPSPDDAKKSGK